ncbi:hypothetical protein D7322_23635 [Sphingobacterium puteale]|uniref:Pectate lyase superfamily protein domain-containing protein n=1 Tax=Sphingobacterium puteale TaxID=2420510 RepID=A0A420VS95_9SPHI|nr:hypothetical protein [Sphingobacterium puteale]RKO69226.1 hypothetical protein D7322_23635 [Sphingobacterium puteale]
MANQFLVKETMAAMRGISAADITALQNGTYAGVELLGYYEKGDTPAPIIYYLAPTTPDPGLDNGGSLIETGGIKLVHHFMDHVHVSYFGATGQGLSDATEGIQKAVNYSAARKIPLVFSENTTYITKAVINLPSDTTLYFNKCIVQKTVQTDGKAIFTSTDSTNITIKELVAEGSLTSPASSGYSNVSSCLYFKNCTYITLEDFHLSKMTSGLMVYYCTGLKVTNGIIRNNILTGVSGFVNNFEFDNVFFKDNGIEADGQTHDVYLINSSNGIFRDLTFDTAIDPDSYNLEVKFSGTQLAQHFDKMEDILIDRCRWIQGKGMDLVAQSPEASDRRPLKRITVKDCDFGATGWARFTGVENCYSINNKGCALQYSTSSTYAGHTPSFTSFNDAFEIVYSNSLSAHYATDVNNVQFINTVVNNKSGAAFRYYEASATPPACTIVNPTILDNSTKAFDAQFIASIGNGRVTCVGGGLADKYKRNMPLNYISGGNITPDNSKGDNEAIFLRIVDTPTVINAPVNNINNTKMRIVLFTAGSPNYKTIAFSEASYKLSQNTITALSANTAGSLMELEFLCYNGVWYQTNDASWSNALFTTNIRRNIAVVSANIPTFTDNLDVVLLDATLGNRTITLPTTSKDGRSILIKKIDSSSNTVVISPAAGHTIDGGAAVTLSAEGQLLEVIFKENKWYTIAKIPVLANTSVAGLVKQALASTDSATAPGATYVQEEVQSLLTELRDLKANLRNAGVLAT